MWVILFFNWFVFVFSHVCLYHFAFFLVGVFLLFPLTHVFFLLFPFPDVLWLFPSFIPSSHIFFVYFPVRCSSSFSFLLFLSFSSFVISSFLSSVAFFHFVFFLFVIFTSSIFLRLFAPLFSSLSIIFFLLRLFFLFDFLPSQSVFVRVFYLPSLPFEYIHLRFFTSLLINPPVVMRRWGRTEKREINVPDLLSSRHLFFLISTAYWKSGVFSFFFLWFIM